MKKHFKKVVPYPLQHAIKRISYYPSDLLQKWRRTNEVLPPKALMMVKPENFLKVGEEFKNYFIKMTNLQPQHKVLDVGCGAGRMALPLTNYLSTEGAYWGLDTRADVIEWCQSHITVKHKNFQFVYGDVYHPRYNPNANLHAKDFKFLFEDGTFDLVFLISVFTHMVPIDIKNYTDEIARVMKTGGHCFITYFLITEDPHSLKRSTTTNLDFIHRGENFFTANKANPESAVGYEKGYIEDLYHSNKLKIEQIHKYGVWSGRDDYLGSQDIVIARKE